jgi:two-component system nitrate/nitrite response regulator NarL
LGEQQKRILLVEDHPLMASAVLHVIEAETEYVVEHFDRASRALASFRPGRYVAGLVDLSLPDKSGLWLIREMRSKDPDVPLCVLSASVADPAAALEAGASGYLSKMVGMELVEAVERLVAGEQVFDATTSDALVKSLLPDKNKPRRSVTKRELTILSLLAEGASVEAIAKTLEISPHTVKDALKSLYPKLGVSDRAAAVAEGFRRGLLR